MDFIYVIDRSEDLIISRKIGSTKHPKSRLANYKTFYFSKTNKALTYDKIYLVDENCYVIDERLKYDPNRGFVRRCETKEYSNVGTEFYQLDNFEQLENWFSRHNIKYKEYDMTYHIEEIRDCSEEDKIKFQISEQRRKAQEAEQERKAQEAEQERKAQEAEQERKAQEAEIILQGYQIDVYSRTVTHLEKNKSCVLDIFCGGGKTVLYQKYFQDHESSYDFTILVVPKLGLMSDMVVRWLPLLTKLNIEYIQIGSNSAGTTSMEKVISFITRHSGGFIFSTYASADIFIDCLSKMSRALIIFDEAHNCCREQLIKKIYSNSSHISNMMFGTATPDYTSSINMTMEKYFGEFICNIPMARLIREKRLCPYKIIVCETEANVKTKANINYYDNAINILKQYLIKGNDLNKVLMYANSVQSVKAIYEQIASDSFFRENNIKIWRVYSGMKEGVEQIKRAFIDCQETAIMINCKIFTEGIDIPALDAVVFCDPKNSQADIIQCFGRALRYQPNKVAKIFIPVADCDAKENRFSILLNIIEVISAQDPKLREEVRQLSKSDGIGNKQGRQSKPNKILEFGISEGSYKILERRLQLVKINTMPEAILYILRDHVPRKSSKIWQEIADRELYAPPNGGKTPKASCSRACINLVRQNKLSQQKEEGVCRYFIPKHPTKITACDFVELLRKNEIKDESDYNSFYCGNYSDTFPINPHDKYPSFCWSLLTAEEEHYLLEKCIQRIAELSPEFYRIPKGATDLEKNKFLHVLDKKIPKNLSSHYGKKLSLINEKLFQPSKR
jgi:superfamily II DNA or RNA helicase